MALRKSTTKKKRTYKAQQSSLLGYNFGSVDVIIIKFIFYLIVNTFNSRC